MTVTAALAAAVFVVAGCSDDTKPDAAPGSPPPPSSAAAAPPAPVPSSPSAEDQAREQVLAAYAKYAAAVDRVEQAGRAPDAGDEREYMTDNARTGWQISGLNLEKDGVRVTGAVTRTPAVSALDLASTPPRATLTVCIDTSAIALVDAAGKRVDARLQAPRYVQTASLLRDGAAGQWRVDDVAPDRQRPC